MRNSAASGGHRGLDMWVGLVGLLCAAAVSFVAVGCNKSSTKEPVKSQPSELPAPAVPNPPVLQTRPSVALEPGPAPEQKPQVPATSSQPAKPASTYSSRPPYPVALFVDSPDDEQPGWLKIEQFDNDKQTATAKGRFPEQNSIYVDTTNVHRIRIHVGYLPLAPNERVILHIDGQGMVLNRNNPYAILNRQPTGAWEPEKQKAK